MFDGTTLSVVNRYHCTSLYSVAFTQLLYINFAQKKLLYFAVAASSESNHVHQHSTSWKETPRDHTREENTPVTTVRRENKKPCTSDIKSKVDLVLFHDWRVSVKYLGHFLLFSFFHCSFLLFLLFSLLHFHNVFFTLLDIFQNIRLLSCWCWFRFVVV